MGHITGPLLAKARADLAAARLAAEQAQHETVQARHETVQARQQAEETRRAMAAVVITFLQGKIGAISDADRARILEADSATLEEWAKQALTATSLTELLGPT